MSRKARKFESQGRRLFLPALELSYVFGSWNSAPRRCLLKGHVPRIDAHLAKLEGQTEDTYEGGHGYWDGESRSCRQRNIAERLQTTAWVTSYAAWLSSCPGIK